MLDGGETIVQVVDASSEVSSGLGCRRRGALGEPLALDEGVEHLPVHQDLVLDSVEQVPVLLEPLLDGEERVLELPQHVKSRLIEIGHRETTVALGIARNRVGRPHALRAGTYRDTQGTQDHQSW